MSEGVQLPAWFGKLIETGYICWPASGDGLCPDTPRGMPLKAMGTPYQALNVGSNNSDEA